LTRELMQEHKTYGAVVRLSWGSPMRRIADALLVFRLCSRRSDVHRCIGEMVLGKLAVCRTRHAI
jgi:hypothetical protein